MKPLQRLRAVPPDPCVWDLLLVETPFRIYELKPPFRISGSATVFNVSGIIFIKQTASNLGKVFYNNQKSLKHLVMNDCRLNSKMILNFVDKLRLTVNMTEAQFCDNEIDDNATEHLVIIILHWNMLKILKLDSNSFSQPSTQIFETLKQLSNWSSTSINFTGKINKINSFISLLEYMKDVHTKNSVLVEKVSKINRLILNCSEENHLNV